MHTSTGAVLLCCLVEQIIDNRLVIFGGTVRQPEKRCESLPMGSKWFLYLMFIKELRIGSTVMLRMGSLP